MDRDLGPEEEPNFGTGAAFWECSAFDRRKRETYAAALTIAPLSATTWDHDDRVRPIFS
jgi:hypothetical protein